MTIVSTILPIAGVRADYNKNNAQAYLESHNDSPWSVMALAALGETPSSTEFLASVSNNKAIGYEAPILAITALGRDPRTFGSTDYVAALKGYHNNGQIGDVAAINDDIFGILALVSAGEPLNEPIISDAKDLILARQNSDGGWGFTVASGSDTNMTSSAILALLASGIESGDSHIQDGLAYLRNSQNNDGGFPYVPGTASDSSSTAWVIWTLNALDINPSDWNKSGNTSVTYLGSNESDQGYFKFQAGSSEDSFSAITTAYAAIALQDKYLPVRTIAGSDKKYSFRIEGGAASICSGEIGAITALDVVKNAKELCEYSYHITDTSFGPYLDQIDNETASGNTGWMYLVNNNSPSVGAADYKLQAYDSVLWYFGDFGLIPERMSLSSKKIGSGQSVTVIVELFNGSSWSRLSGAIVHYGANMANTDINGETIIVPGDGFYKILAEKPGYIRSETQLLQVGEPSDSVVGLNVNIEKSDQKPPESSVSFVVSTNSLDFGTLAPGASALKNFKIINNGTTDIYVESVVSGDPVFTQNLKLDNEPWDDFGSEIAKNNEQSVDAGLSIPKDYAQEGSRSGQMIIWAMAK